MKNGYNIADCSVYGDKISTKYTCENLIKTTNILGLTVNGFTSSVSSNKCNVRSIWLLETTNATGFTFENVTFDQNTIGGVEGRILEVSHDVSYNEETMDTVAIPEIVNCKFTSNKLQGF